MKKRSRWAKEIIVMTAIIVYVFSVIDPRVDFYKAIAFMLFVDWIWREK